jgi:hypothetical protein
MDETSPSNSLYAKLFYIWVLVLFTMSNVTHCFQRNARRVRYTLRLCPCAGYGGRRIISLYVRACQKMMNDINDDKFSVVNCAS